MSSESDSKIYTDVLTTLKEELGSIYNCSDNSFILAISRKGPRMLESIFKPKEADGNTKLNVVTELSLPYFFNYLTDSPQKPSEIYLFDDAVYFGTTIESVYQEIKEYLKIYDLPIKVKVCTGVKTKESKELGFEVKAAVPEVRDGYGHYYIRQLTRDIRNLCMPFELEFPIVYYNLQDVNLYNSDIRNQLIKSLKDIFGETMVYDVTYNNEEVYNITVLLNSVNDMTSINKLRIYPSSDGRIAVTCISPYILPDSEAMFERAWINDAKFGSIWKEIYVHSVVKSGNTSTDLLRNRRKSLMMLYSYLNSFRFFLNVQMRLHKAFNTLSDDNFLKCEGLKEKDVFYLVGHKGLSHKIYERLNYLLNASPERGLFVRRLLEYPSFPVFELADFPSPEERGLLEFRNIENIKNSQTIQQALSVLFFNQNCLVEKWSRKYGKYDSRRLRFGQTFESIYQNVKILNTLNKKEDEILSINKWIDRRIDQGCVVPQYIKSITDNHWYRVFRPGENEDAILSHLTRIVLLVFTELKKITGRTEVEESSLKWLLNIPFISDVTLTDLSKELDIPLYLKADGTLCYLDDDTIDDYELYTPLVQRLIDLDILEVDKDKIVKVSKSFTDDELAKVTTLDYAVESSYRQGVDKVLEDLKLLDPRLFFTVFNFYSYKSIELDLQKLEERVFKYADTCDDAMLLVERISKTEPRQYKPMDLFNMIINPYIVMRNMILNEMYWLNNHDRLSELTPDYVEQERLVVIQQKLTQIRAIIEFILFTYVNSNYSSFKLRLDYFAGHDSKYKNLFVELKDTLSILSDKVNFEKNIWDIHVIRSIRFFINNVIKQ